MNKGSVTWGWALAATRRLGLRKQELEPGHAPLAEDGPCCRGSCCELQPRCWRRASWRGRTRQSARGQPVDSPAATAMQQGPAPLRPSAMSSRASQTRQPAPLSHPADLCTSPLVASSIMMTTSAVRATAITCRPRPFPGQAEGSWLHSYISRTHVTPTQPTAPQTPVLYRPAICHLPGYAFFGIFL